MTRPNYEIRIPFLPIIQKALEQLAARSSTKEDAGEKPGPTIRITFPLDEFSPEDLESTRRFFSEMTEILSLEISSRLLPPGTLLEPQRSSSEQTAVLPTTMNTDVKAGMASGGRSERPTLSKEPATACTAANANMEAETNSGGIVEPLAPSERSSPHTAAHMAVEAHTGPERTKEPQNAKSHEENADLPTTRRSERITARKSLLTNKKVDESKLGTGAVNTDVETNPNTGGTVEPLSPSERSSLHTAAHTTAELRVGPGRTKELQNAGSHAYEENADLQITRRSERITARKSLLASKEVDEESELGADANPGLVPVKRKARQRK